MSAVDIFNKKFLQCQEIDTKIAKISKRQEDMSNYLINIDNNIATITSKKETVDTELAIVQANLPSDVETYQTILISCNDINVALNTLNNERAFYVAEFENISSALEVAIEKKNILDAEYATALSTL